MVYVTFVERLIAGGESHVLVGLVGACALLLGAAGLMKVLAPDGTARAVLATDLPGATLLAGRPLIRILGMAELTVALLAVLVGNRLSALLLAVAYALLALVAWRLARHAPGQDCGCFGSSGTPGGSGSGSDASPAGNWHIGVNAVATGIAIACAVAPQPALVDSALRGGVAGAALAAGTALLAWLGYLMMTALPELLTSTAKVTATR